MASFPPVRAALGKRLAPAATSRLAASLPVVEPLPCSYARHSCTRSRIDGYEYCIRHILEDKSSPFKQCSYVSSQTGRRCTQAVDKSERCCAAHVTRQQSQAQSRSVKPTPSRQPNLDTAASLLAKLESHHGPNARLPIASRSQDSQEDSTTSGSDDDLTFQPLSDTLGSQDAADSDAESVDSEQENALKHAGVFTAEEVALMFRDKLIRLQSLYIDQFKRLHHRLKENRRQYIRAMRSAIRSSADSEDADSRNTAQKMTALSRYYKKFGKEALLVRQCKERRIAFSEGSAYIAPVYPTCAYTSATEEACNERSLPLSQYCLQHIISDNRQVLYTSCNYGDACSQPVASIAKEPRCQLHRHLELAECRYSHREIELHNKEEHVDVVTVGDTKL